MKLLLKLYPAEWLARYGDELEALMYDARIGWRESLDLIKGAIDMRVRLQPAVIVVGLVPSGDGESFATSAAALGFDVRAASSGFGSAEFRRRFTGHDVHRDLYRYGP
jgi:hypothetical protein